MVQQSFVLKSNYWRNCHCHCRCPHDLSSVSRLVQKPTQVLCDLVGCERSFLALKVHLHCGLGHMTYSVINPPRHGEGFCKALD